MTGQRRDLLPIISQERVPRVGAAARATAQPGAPPGRPEAPGEVGDAGEVGVARGPLLAALGAKAGRDVVLLEQRLPDQHCRTQPERVRTAVVWSSTGERLAPKSRAVKTQLLTRVALSQTSDVHETSSEASANHCIVRTS